MVPGYSMHGASDGALPPTARVVAPCCPDPARCLTFRCQRRSHIPFRARQWWFRVPLSLSVRFFCRGWCPDIDRFSGRRPLLGVGTETNVLVFVVVVGREPYPLGTDTIQE